MLKRVSIDSDLVGDEIFLFSFSVTEASMVTRRAPALDTQTHVISNTGCRLLSIELSVSAIRSLNIPYRLLLIEISLNREIGHSSTIATNVFTARMVSVQLIGFAIKAVPIQGQTNEDKLT